MSEIKHIEKESTFYCVCANCHDIYQHHSNLGEHCPNESTELGGSLFLTTTFQPAQFNTYPDRSRTRAKQHSEHYEHKVSAYESFVCGVEWLNSILKSAIDDNIANLADEDTDGHIWWNKFRELIIKINGAA